MSQQQQQQQQRKKLHEVCGWAGVLPHCGFYRIFLSFLCGIQLEQRMSSSCSVCSDFGIQVWLFRCRALLLARPSCCTVQ